MSEICWSYNCRATLKLFNSYLAMASYKYGPFAADRKRRRVKARHRNREAAAAAVQQLVAAEEVVIEVSLSSPGLSS